MGCGFLRSSRSAMTNASCPGRSGTRQLNPTGNAARPFSRPRAGRLWGRRRCQAACRCRLWPS
eukprot:11438835-Alexandrium_andersonii.AAC.1